MSSVKAELATWGDAALYSVQLFSSLKKTGVEDAEVVLANWLGIEKKKPEEKKKLEIKKPENKRPPDKGSPGAKKP